MNKKLIKNLKLKIKNYERGFTLVEILIFMGIFSILLISLFQLLIAIFDVQLESQSTSVVSQDGRYIINKLTYDIQNAASISSPPIGSQATSFQTISGGVSYIYNLSNGNLTITNSSLGTTDQLNSVNSSVSDLTFFRLADINNQNDTITVFFTVNSKTQKRSGINSESFKTTIGKR